MDMLDFLRRETPHLSSDTPPTLFEHADANEGYIPGKSFQIFSWYGFKILLPFLDQVKLFWTEWKGKTFSLPVAGGGALAPTLLY